MKRDLDIGEIVLEDGPVLRGSIPGCASGQLTMTPLPDLTKPLTVPFFDSRRIQIAPDGDFAAEDSCDDDIVGREFRGRIRAADADGTGQPLLIQLNDILGYRRHPDHAQVRTNFVVAVAALRSHAYIVSPSRGPWFELWTRHRS